MNYTIVRDDNAISPRENDNLGTIAYGSRRYILGDHFASSDELAAIINDRNNIALPVHAYIHSGVSLNTVGFSDPWDSGKSGYIYVSKDKVREWFGVKRISPKLYNRVLSVLTAEIEEYNLYLNGESYGYIIKDDDGNEIDSCWGFLGEDVAKEAAEEAVSFFSKRAA